MDSTPSTSVIVFGPFRLDPGQAQLLRNGSPVDLSPKAFDLLAFLAQRRGELVTKDELLDAVWGRRFVTEGVVKTVVGQLREALADDARQPKWIETVMRRGYRFIGQTSGMLTTADITAASPEPTIIGRQETLAALQATWQAAQKGRKGVVFLAGEPGIGKSTVITAFVQALQEGAVGSGQSIEHHGAGEPYLPVLEALDGLVRADVGRRVLLRTFAPTWLAQLPWLQEDKEKEELQRSLAGVGQERMVREFGILIDKLAEVEPVVLVLEDLHWSDASTVQLLGHLARRRAPARWMVVGSYRPADVVTNDHPFDTLRRELRLHRLCADIHLDGFSLDQVQEFLSQRLPGWTSQSKEETAVASALLAHTDGLPLFLTCVVDELVDQAELRLGDDGRWTSPASEALPIPDNLLHLTEKQLQRLAPELQELLAAAALAPVEFDHLALADALQMDAHDVHAQLEQLVRRRLWLRAAAPAVLPDGRVAARYSFGHALFRHTFGRQLGGAARIMLHRRLLKALLELRGAQAPAIAVELAWHAERAGETAQAAQWLGVAAHHALQRIAPREALNLTTRGLDLLSTLGPGPGQEARLPLLGARIQALIITEGYGTAAVVQAVLQAFALVEGGDPIPQTMPLWHATWWTLNNAGMYERVRALEERLKDAAGHSAHPVVRSAALNLLAIGAIHRHELEPAAVLLAESLEAQRSTGPAAASFVQDPALEALVHLQYLHEVAGRFAQAVQARAEIEQRLASGTDPLSETMALWYMAYAHYYRRDLAGARALLARGQAVVDARSALPGHGPYHVLTGGVLALDGQAAEGRARVLEGLRVQYQPEHGSMMGSGAARATVAQALLCNGQWDEADAQLRTAQVLAERPELRLCWPEQYRVRAALHWERGDGLALAASAWQEAVAIAQRSGALLFELLATHDWARALDKEGHKDEARARLADILERVTLDAAALDCPAVASARALHGALAP